MAKNEILHSILIVSASEQFAAAAKTTFPERSYMAVEIRKNAAGARRFLLERYCDIMLINSPLPDESGIELALDTAEKDSVGIMIAVPADHYGDVSDRFTEQGVFAVAKPMPRERMAKTMRMLLAIQDKMHLMRQEVNAMQEKIEELRTVDKAKFILIEKEHMTEDEAHRFIGKQAMDNGISRKKAAERILEEAEMY